MGQGFWGGGFNMMIRTSPTGSSGQQTIRNAEPLHDQRVNNAMGGYGFITNAEVMSIQANAYVRDPETGELVFAGSSPVWIEDTPWHQSGILDQIGLGARGFADDLTMGFVSWVERKQGRLSPEEEEWLAHSSVHNAGGWAGLAAGLIIPGPGKAKAAVNVVSKARTAGRALGLGERFVGPGYTELAPGVFRSANGLRQFRMTARDLIPTHGTLGPHVHFEVFNQAGAKIRNFHVPLK